MNPLNKQGLGRNGMSSIKLEDFQKRYKWQLDEGYGHERKNTILGMPLQEYYELGTFCIINKISITGFIKMAMRERKYLVNLGLIDIDADNSALLANSIEKKNKKTIQNIEKPFRTKKQKDDDYKKDQGKGLIQ